MRPRAWLCFVACLLFACLGALPSAQAADADEEAYAHHMELGIRLFEDRNYDAASTEFERAYEKRKKASPLINLALCYKGRFEYTKAIVVLERALAEHTDSMDNPEKIRKAVAEMKELLGTVKVTVSAPGVVRVHLDGDLLEPGTERKPIDVSPGRHTMSVEVDGYISKTRDFRVASGDALDLKFGLLPAEGVVSVESEREDAGFAINGEPMARGTSWLRLKPGLHLVEVLWPGRRHSANFAITSGKTTKIKLRRNGELTLGSGSPKQPETIPLPPVSGLYMLGLVDAGVRLGTTSAPIYATSMRVGYRPTRIVGLEGELRGIMSSVDYFDEEEFVDAGTMLGMQVRANVRVMSPSDLVRAVATFGVGYVYEAAYGRGDDAPTGHGFCANIEPGLDVDISGFIVGFHTPVAISFPGVGFGFELSGGVHLGYGVW